MFGISNFFSTLIVLGTVAVAVSAERDYLDDYFDKVVGNFNQQLDGVGVASLRINDTIIAVNRSISGVPLVGTVKYTNFIILEVAPLEARSEGHRGSPEDDGIHLYYQINFPNLTILSDVAAELAPLGTAQGTGQLFFLNTSIAVHIDKNYTLGTTEVSTGPYATEGPSTNFLPVSDVMDAASADARLELGYALMWDHVKMWCDQTFTSMIQKAVNSIEFPMFPPS